MDFHVLLLGLARAIYVGFRAIRVLLLLPTVGLDKNRLQQKT
jgi:hypothetical protein